MFYISEVVNKPILFQGKMQAKLLDFVVSEDTPPTILTALIKKNRKKYLITLANLEFKNNSWFTDSKEMLLNPYDDKMFYLVEDLLDKQVIDVNGRRLVRVNDVLIKQNGHYVVEGIDIGASGVFRRLGLGNPFGLKNITLPWSYIEAFDYQTGNVRIKVSQNNLNTFHPAEIADILEEVGTKERLGIVEALDAKRAAAAIEEADEETQSAILEQIPESKLGGIVNRMHLSEIADVLHELNSFTKHRIFSLLGIEKTKNLRKLLVFEDDEAGGLMDLSFIAENSDTTVGDLIQILDRDRIKPETVVLINSENKLAGVISIKNILTLPKSSKLANCVKNEHFVYQNETFSTIFQLFAEYNLRSLPVVSDDKTVLGVIRIDRILAHIQQEEERNNTI